MVDWKKPPEQALHHGPVDPELVRRHAEEGREAAAMSSTGVAYEKADVGASAMVRLGIGLAAMLLAVVGLSFGLFKALRSSEAKAEPPRPPLAIREVGRVPPEPRLQTQPVSDFAALETRQRDAVESYGWVDRDAGVVKIPIEEAMRLYVQRQTGTPRTGTEAEIGTERGSGTGVPEDASAPYPPGGERR